jgi:hypothetical protein
LPGLLSISLEPALDAADGRHFTKGRSPMMIVMMNSPHRRFLAVVFGLMLAGGLALGAATGSLPFG